MNEIVYALALENDSAEIRTSASDGKARHSYYSTVFSVIYILQLLQFYKIGF